MSSKALFNTIGAFSRSLRTVYTHSPSKLLLTQSRVIPASSHDALSHLLTPSPSRSIYTITSSPWRQSKFNQRPDYSFRLLTTKAHTADDESGTEDQRSRRYAWIDEEARELIARAYSRHKALADNSRSFPPSLSVKELEAIGTPHHYAPQDFLDRCALQLMRGLRVFVHGFFREKYDHHAVCLETVAAVPGIVGGFHRHLRSLRRMKRDHGWISVLQEEAENERMHLLIFMQVCKPTLLERSLVVFAQGLYLTFYSALYLFNSRGAHRLTGYLEEEAHRAYTDYLASIDSGKIKNKPAPLIARNYYHLNEDATMRDVVLHVRADEAMHRDVNHHLGDKYKNGDTDSAADVFYKRD